MISLNSQTDLERVSSCINSPKEKVALLDMKNLQSIGTETTLKDEECAICMSALKESESIELPGCKHNFHKSCVY